MPDLRLAIPAAALWVCCGVGVGAAAVMPALAAVAGVAAVVTLSVAALRSCGGLRRRGHGGASTRPRAILPASAVSIALAAVALGAVSVATAAPARSTPALEAAAREHQQVEVALRVEGSPKRSAPGLDGSEHWRLRGTTVGGSAAGVPVSVIVPADLRTVRAITLGSVIALTASVRPNDPGEATTFTLRGTTSLTIREPPPPWLAWPAPVRSAFAEASARTPGDGGDLLPGLAIGDEAAVTADLDAAMKASALSHLTAVSGANCALVTGLVFLLARVAGLGRRSRIVAAATALGAFVVLVGPGASVIRAAAMASVVLLGLARGRVADGLPALALAVVVLLVHDPWLARDYGFALSVLATTGLLVLARPLALALGRWLPRGVALALAVPLAAQLACQPVLILLTPTLPLFGVPANLVAEPAAPVATVLGCLACLVLPWAPALGEVVVWLAWLPSAWIAAVARFSAGLPGAALPWPDGLVGVGLCALVLVAVALLAARSRLPRPVGSTAAIALVGGTTVYAGVLGGLGVGAALGRPGDWVYAACDVGQGDALLLRDDGHVGLIDVGRRPQPVADCLDTLGVARLDWVLLTHFDADHVGGADAVLGRTGRAFVGQADRPADTALLTRLAAAGIAVEQIHAGAAGALGRLRWRVVWPPPPGLGETALSGNAGSLVLRTDGAGVDALFLGDLGEHEQDLLLRTGALGAVEVVKVSHHGSADQSAALYEGIHARLGLVSVGDDNGYGHPTARALDLLARSGTAAARTDRSGMLLVSPGPDGPRLWAERDDPGAAAAAGGPLYPLYGRGGTWRHEATAGAVHEVGRPARPRRAPSRSSPGTRSARRRSSWCPAPRGSSQTGPRGCCATASSRRTRAWRSATSRRRTTRRGSCSPSRAPPCSGSPGSSGWTRSRRPGTRSSPICSTTWPPRPTARSSSCGTPAGCAARSCSTRSAPGPAEVSRSSAPSSRRTPRSTTSPRPSSRPPGARSPRARCGR
ncbi:MBL fold metallo-hydrolase [Leifsonia shinshuensis]|uniref:MBL fold metallo-hydrolase n=1 Tax=Leifsonia shinshuensis TaxID=150026 RepID=A0A7G6Y6W5_9MICO|nr:MBL fold metallo-hydrolase [Leifsonia shinshuensis]